MAVSGESNFPPYSGQTSHTHKERNTYVAEKRKEMAEKEGNKAEKTLDEAVASTVRAQAEKKGYAFEK